MFQSGGNFGYNIYVVNADGSGRLNLTGSTTNNWFPFWSPDGTQIVFSRTRDWDTSNSMVNAEIYIMNADGSNVRRLTISPGIDEYPRWSPDGTKIAFVSRRSDGSQIWVMNASDGSNPTQVTNDFRDCFAPTWSADSQRIAYVHSGSSYTIRQVAINGSGAASITNSTYSATNPAWSP